MTIQVYYCKLNTRFTIINLQYKKERLSYVSMRDYKALCVAVIKCQQHNLIWDKTNRSGEAYGISVIYGDLTDGD